MTAVLVWAAWIERPRREEPPASTAPRRKGHLLAEGILQGELAGGERHRYPLALEAGRYLRIEVHQRGVDLVLRLLSPAGALIQESDGWTGQWGPDPISLVTDTAGVYFLELLPASETAAAGPYDVHVAEYGEANERNRRRAAGERAVAEARRLYLMGQRQHLEAAEVKFRQAIDSFDAAADRAGQADSYYGLGVIAADLGRAREASRQLGRAGALARSLRDRRREADALVRRAIVQRRLGDAYQSLNDASRALLLWHAVPDSAREVARVLSVLTGIYAELGDRPRTRAYADLALREARALGEDYALSDTLRCYAGAQLWLGQPEAALAALQEALILARRFGERDKPLEAMLLSNLGAAQHALQRDDEARATLGKALSRFRTDGDRSWEMETLLQLASTYGQPDERERRRELAEAVLRLARELGSGRHEAAALAMLGGHELEAGRLRQARRLLEESISISEDRWRLVPSASLQAAYLANQFDGYELYVDVLVRSWREAVDPHGAAQALTAVEGARARSLQAQLLRAREEARGGVPAELLERRRALGQELLARAPSRRGDESVDTTLAREGLAAQLRRLERQIGEISPRYGDLMLTRPITVEEMQEDLLDDETVLLEYSLGRKRSHLWVVSRSRLRVVELPPKDQVEAAARAVVEAVTARSATVRFETGDERQTRVRAADSAFPRAAATLAAMVLRPVARDIAGKRLLIVSDGALQYVPWSALPRPGREGDSDAAAGHVPLAATHEIVHLPSAAVLRTIRRGIGGRPSPSGTVAVVADPVLGPRDPRLVARRAAANHDTLGSRPAPALDLGAARHWRVDRSPTWPALPHARAEAQSILGIVPPTEGLGAFGFAASRQLVTGPELGRYRIVHFATHAVVDTEQPDRSGIVLSTLDEHGRRQDGFLSLFDVYHLRLAADLVVLSGCRTALGQELRAEGLVGLTRGFMFAGSPRVIVSLWDVEDRATAELMKRFYALMLRGGRRPAAALREAQAVMAASERWREPYYWAGFVLQGDWQ